MNTKLYCYSFGYYGEEDHMDLQFTHTKLFNKKELQAVCVTAFNAVLVKIAADGRLGTYYDENADTPGPVTHVEQLFDIYDKTSSFITELERQGFKPLEMTGGVHFPGFTNIFSLKDKYPMLDPEDKKLLQSLDKKALAAVKDKIMKEYERVKREKSQKILCNKAKCTLCGDIIESKYRHDFVACKCGKLMVDGGKDYLKRCGDLEHCEELSTWSEPKEE